MKLRFDVVVAALLSILAGGMVYGKDACVSVGELRVCVQVKGSCDIGHLVSTEKTTLNVDLLFVTILNKSSLRIKIVPEHFYGITVSGRVIAIDPPFYESIELKTKLCRKDLDPQESMTGFLFFPSSLGQIRKLVYGGNPYFEIMLF
jgi:hypothetical protein